MGTGLREKPTSLAGCREVMAKVVFTAVVNWRPVEPRWPGISETLFDFDVDKVAALTPDDYREGGLYGLQ